MIFITYEDRLPAMVGVEILARSLQRHNPAYRLTVWSPHRRCTATGLSEHDVDWRVIKDLVGVGWNVKPTILLRALQEAPRAMWLDSDIIVVSSLERAIALPQTSLVVSQEFRSSGYMGSRLRAQGWDWAVTRTLPMHVNSGAVIATRDHEPLLQAWACALSSDKYQAAQRILPVTARPTHLLGDQDVLWALLCCEYGEIPVRFLANGRDIIQDSGANGYHVVDRLKSLFVNDAMLVHALGKNKPWHFGDQVSQGDSTLSYITQAVHEVSAYFVAAQLYAEALHNPPWLKRHTKLARLISASLPHTLAGPGLLLALIAWVKELTIDRVKLHKIEHSS